MLFECCANFSTCDRENQPLRHSFAVPLPGLRHPASAALCLRLAGRGPNSDSLFPPLAAVVVVAPSEGRLWHIVKLYLFARGADCQSSATPVKKISAGVFQSRHFLGRLFNKAITLSRSSSEITRKSQPFGKKKRSRPFVFSFVPLCHGA